MILWIYERYYLFTIILLIYSLYNYWKTATEVRRNQEKLAFESYFDVQCKVLTREEDGVELCTDPIK